VTLSNDPPSGFVRRFEPRATRIPITHREDIDVEIWVGGSDTAIGEEVEVLHLDGAWLIDCAGEIPTDFREAALAVYPRVFADIEVIPSNIDRIASLAREIADSILGRGFRASNNDANSPSVDARSPERVFVMCTQGFNRSALVAGLILRELGAEPQAVIEAIRRARPGALTNQTFVRLLKGEPG
jgi:hypothetical protein